MRTREKNKKSQRWAAGGEVILFVQEEECGVGNLIEDRVYGVGEGKKQSSDKERMKEEEGQSSKPIKGRKNIQLKKVNKSVE